MKSICSLLLCAFTAGACFAQTITTVAGTGDGGFGGDGGPGSLAQLSDPRSMTVDGKGNLYILDSVNNRVRKVATSGTITTVAGNGDISSAVEGPATQTGLLSPYDIAALPDGTLYIADADGLQKVDGSGNLSFVATGGAVTAIKISKQGVFYTGGIARIYRLEDDLSLTPIAGSDSEDPGDGGPATEASFWVTDFTTDPAGDVYILDHIAGRVRKFTPGGTIRTIAGTGTSDFSGDGGPAVEAQFDYPTGIAVDVAGNVYIADTNNFRIRRVNTAGIISTFAGTGQSISNGDGGPVQQASFLYPAFLTVSCTALYVSDNERVRAIALTDPLIALKGITNNQTGAVSIRAGAAFQISGCNLAGSPATAGASQVLSLAGTSVTLNGVRVPVLSVSPTQVVAQVPAGFSPGAAVVVVSLDGKNTTATAGTVVE